MRSLLALLAFSLFPSPPGDKTPVTLASKPLVECDAKVVRLAANEKGLMLLCATEHGNVCAWNVAKAEFAWRNAPDGLKDHVEAKSEQDVPYLRALDVGEKFAFLGRGIPVPSSLELVSGRESSDYTMLVLDPSVQIVALRCDPRDRWAWMALENGVLVRYIPNATGRAYNSRTLKGVKLRSLAYDADALLIAAGGADGTIHFVNASSANVDDEKVLKGPDAALTAMDFASKGTLLLAGTEKGDVALWNVGTGKLRQTAHASDAALRQLLVHPKNKWYVTGDAIGAVKLWSLDKCELIGTLTADGATKVFDLAFLDGAKLLAGAVGTNSVVVWDVSKF